MSKNYSLAKTKYLAVLATVSFIFAFAFLAGKMLSDSEAQNLSSLQNEFKLQLLGLDIQRSLIEASICNVDILELTGDRSALGRRLDTLERSQGLESPEVASLKREYMLLSIRQWLFVKKAKEICPNSRFSIILFFYSNTDSYEASQLQGKVLNYLYRKYPEKIITYSIDFDTGDPAIKSVKALYGVTRAPSVVVDGKLLDGFRESSEIEPLIEK